MDTRTNIIGTALSEANNELFRAHFEIKRSRILLFCDDEPTRGDFIQVDDVEFLPKNKVLCDSRSTNHRTKVFLSNGEFKRFVEWWYVYGDNGETDSEESDTDSDNSETEPMNMSEDESGKSEEDESDESESKTTIEIPAPRGWFGWLW